MPVKIKKNLLEKKEQALEQGSLGLYIHIPFCKYICKYCDFCKKYIKHYDTSTYIDYLILDLQKYTKYFSKINTIYIGGGTPSSLPQKDLQKLFDYLNQKIDFVNIIEYTIEANPDDITTSSYAMFLRNNNINRVSLGVQTLNNELLEIVNRNHTKDQVQNALDILSKYIKNINIDLMFNLPKQTQDDIQKSFNFIKKNQEKITHVSYYSLILEEDTILYNENFENFSEEEEDLIYKNIQSNLKSLGYFQYEISNYAKLDFESKHNLKYWQRQEYIGVGLGASSFLNNIRYTNTKSYNDYINGLKQNSKILIEEETLNKDDEIQEIIMLGLRLNKGLNKEVFIKNNLEIDSKYMKNIGENVAIREEYLFLSNQIILSYLEKL